MDGFRLVSVSEGEAVIFGKTIIKYRSGEGVTKAPVYVPTGYISGSDAG